MKFNKDFWSKNKGRITLGVVGAVGSAALLFPESAFAVKLGDQLDAVNTLTTGKIKTVGLSAATIGGGIYSLCKGSPKLALIIVGIGIGLGYYLTWIQAGLKL